MEQLDWLTESVRAAAGENLVAMMMYDPRQRGDQGSDLLQLVLVLVDVVGEALGTLRDPLREASRRLRARPYILSADDPTRMADALPLKCLMFRLRGRMLIGENPFLDVTVTPQHIRLRIEQEARNLLIRLRHDLTMASGVGAKLTTALWRTKLGVERIIEGVFHLSDRETEHPEDLFDFAITHCGLPKAPLRALQQFGGAHLETDVEATAEHALDALGALVQYIDRKEL